MHTPVRRHREESCSNTSSSKFDSLFFFLSFNMEDVEKAQPLSPPLAPNDDATLPVPCCHCSWKLPSPAVAAQNSPGRQLFKRNDNKYEGCCRHGCQNYCRGRRRRSWWFTDFPSTAVLFLLLAIFFMATGLLFQSLERDDDRLWNLLHEDNVALAVPIEFSSWNDLLSGTNVSDTTDIVTAVVEGLGQPEDARAGGQEAAAGDADPEEVLHRRGEHVEAEATTLRKRGQVDDNTSSMTTMITRPAGSVGPAGSR